MANRKLKLMYTANSFDQAIHFMRSTAISNLKFEISDLKSQISDFRSQISNLLFVAAAAMLALLAVPRTASAADGQLLLPAVEKDPGEPIACRIHLQNGNGKPVKIPGT